MAITHVGDSTGATGTTATLASSYTSTAGNTLVAYATAYMTGNNAVSLTGITDTAGNTWTVIPGPGLFNAAGYYAYCAAAFCVNAAAVTSVTATWSTAPTIGSYLQASEFAGVPAGAALDASATASPNQPASASYATPSATPAAATDITLAVAASDAPWTGVSPGTLLLSGQAAWNIITSPGTAQSFTFTAASDRAWTALTAAIGLPAGGVTYNPQRYGQAAPPSPAPWAQRDRRDALTVATAANPLTSPLDSAWQADAAYSHLYGDPHLRDRRQYYTQRPYVSQPGLLAGPAQADPTQSAWASLQVAYGMPALWRTPPPQPRQWAAPDVDLGTAELENELLGGADSNRHYLIAAYWDRREVPQQRPYISDPSSYPVQTEVGAGTTEAWWGADTDAFWRYQKILVSDPALLTPAGPLDPVLAARLPRLLTLTTPATHQDRREVPQQRAYVSDPSSYPTVAPADPLTLAWGAGGPYWHLYNRAADAADRREYPPQRLYQSDPLLLATALLENELLGGAETGKYYRTPATHAPRWWMPQQRTYLGADLTTALLENELLGGADASRHAAWTRPGSWPAQRAYISDPSFYPTSGVTDPVTLAWGAGGVYWHLYNQPADITDRREYPQQRARVSDPFLLATAELENELLGGCQTGAYYRVPASHAPRWWMPEQRAYVSDPFLLTTAELENELLGSAETPKTYRTPVTHYDRREVPAQRTYYALPQLFLDPVQSAWASLWLAYNMPATHVARRLVPQQKDLRDANTVAVPPPAVIKGFSTAYGVTEPMLSSSTTGEAAGMSATVT